MPTAASMLIAGVDAERVVSGSAVRAGQRGGDVDRG